MLEFCGEGFVKQFVFLDHEDYPIMLSGCLLLSFAHSMALTGLGSRAILLELKGQVIRRISAKMKSDGLLSPWCLTAVLALGATIVCLISHDLPKRLSIWEYNNATMEDSYLCCCPEFVDKAQSALAERIVHRQAMQKLLCRSKASFNNAHSLALLQYISNFVNM